MSSNVSIPGIARVHDMFGARWLLPSRSTPSGFPYIICSRTTAGLSQRLKSLQVPHLSSSWSSLSAQRLIRPVTTSSSVGFNMHYHSSLIDNTEELEREHLKRRWKVHQSEAVGDAVPGRIQVPSPCWPIDFLNEQKPATSNYFEMVPDEEKQKEGYSLLSTKRQRVRKMRKHKYKKRLKETRHERKKMGKI